MKRFIITGGWLLQLLTTISDADSADTCINGLPNTIQLTRSFNQDHSSLTPNSLSEQGHQLIFTGAQFDCHGYISNWTALTALDNRFITLTHQIYFQVWRPTGDRTYKLVGSEKLSFSEQELRAGVLTGQHYDSDLRYFYFAGKSSRGAQQSPIHFQPGDLIGCYIPPLYRTPTPSLSVVYTGANHSDTSGDMLVTYTSSPNSCQVVDCGDSVDRTVGVVPQINVGYAPLMLKEAPSYSMQQNCVPSDSPSCCPFPATVHEQIVVLNNCLKTSFTSDVCQSAIRDTRHLEPSMSSTAGHHIIFPGIRFSCHGYIDSWSALTILDIRYVQPYTLTHHIFLQVWRALGNGKYHLVGSEELKFGPEDLVHVHKIRNSHNAYFAFTKKSGTIGDDGINGRIHFKPGDVIGSFIPARFGTLTPPLSFVYSLATEGGGTEMLVDTMEGVACEINECSGDRLMDSNVVPWISMKTVAVEPPHDVDLSRSCNASLVSACSSPTKHVASRSTVPWTTPPPCNESCKSESLKGPYGILPILATTAILVFASISLTACSVVFCLVKRRCFTGRRRDSTAQPKFVGPYRRGPRSREKIRTGSSITDQSELDTASVKVRLSEVRLVGTGVTVMPKRNRGSVGNSSTHLSDLLEFHSYSRRNLNDLDASMNTDF